MWNSQVIIMLLEGIRDTLYMTLASTLFGYIIGLPSMRLAGIGG